MHKERDMQTVLWVHRVGETIADLEGQGVVIYVVEHKL